MENNNAPYQPEEKINPRVYFKLFFKAWKWYALSFIICLIIGMAYLRYSTSIYTSQTTILMIEDEENILIDYDAINLDRYSLGRKTEAEAVILKSRFLLEKVVQNQKLNIQVFSLTGRTELKLTEVYEDPTFTISQSTELDSLLYDKKLEFEIHPISHTSFELTVGNKPTAVCKIHDVFNVGEVELRLTPNSDYRKHWLNYKYKVVITPIDQVVSRLQQEISINDEKFEVGILVLSLNGPTPARNDDIIDGLIKEYQVQSIIEKNRVANSTNVFIDRRLILIEKELSMIETSAETLKKENDVLDIDITYSSILLKQNELDKYIINTEVQLAVVRYVQEYINEKGHKLIPVNLGLVSTPLVKAINAYNLLFNEFTQLKKTTGDKNPKVINMENEFAPRKLNLQKSMNSLILSQELRLKELKAQYELGEQKIALLPRFQKQQRNIDRHKQIIESLYLFLLKKKEENEIILASTIADCRVIDKAFSNPSPISPNKRVVYILIVAISITTPSIGLYLKAVFNNKVLSPEDMEKYGIPLFGTLPNNKEKEPSYSKQLNNPISDSFRKLRVLLTMKFGIEQKYSNTLLVTSLKSKEGKTFTSLNLGRSIADIGKKVVVIDVDLHSQGLAEQVNINPSSKGVSSYVSDENLPLKDILIASSEFDKLAFISSGPSTDHPSEILANPRIQKLIEQAKKEFEYVIIDAGSLDTAIDTYLLVPHIDMTLLICKAGTTRTEDLKTIRNYSIKNSLGNTLVVFNSYAKKLVRHDSSSEAEKKWPRRLINNLKNTLKRN
ncbi:MAG: AAA family ATPase [Crocinitomicaceae bacterium]|nr:AAA family ATPase [Crocinitomicaceae bacterium]